MDAPTNSPTLAGLLRELRDEVLLLLRQELHLAKVEISDSAAKLRRETAMLLGGAAVAFAGALFVLAGLSVLVAFGLGNAGLGPMAAWTLGPAIIGVVVLAIGAGLFFKAKRTLQDTSLVPHETLESLKEDKQWTQEKLART